MKRALLFLLTLFQFPVLTAGAQTLFGLRSNDVVAINPTTAAQTYVATLPAQASMSAIDPAGQRLFLANSTSLFTINLRAGTFTQLPLAGATLQEIVYDPITGLLFGLKNSATTIVTINPANGALQLLGATGINSILAGGLSIDAAGRRLFFIDSRTTLEIFSLQTLTTSSVPLASEVSAAKFDPLTGKLIGATVVSKSFVLVNPATGAVQTLAPYPLFQIVGSNVVKIGYDPTSRVAFIYGFTSSSFTFAIVFINLNTNVVSSINDPAASFVNPVEIASLATPVPSLSRWMMAVLMLLLAFLGVIKIAIR